MTSLHMPSTQLKRPVLRALTGALCMLVLCLGVLLAPAKAQALALEGEPAITEAWAAIVTDEDGNILWSLNPDGVIAPASITKVMTAVVALDSGVPFDTQVEVFKPDVPDYSQLAGYESGTVSLDELMRVMLVYSANDAAVLVAHTTAGSEEAFVERMNAKAQELGLTNTHFANPHGLEEEGHHSSARDLVVLAKYAMDNYPYIARTVRLHEVTVRVNDEERTFESTDDLVRTYPGAIGIKTGKTESGCTFMGACERGGIRVYSVVLGCPTSEGRFNDTAAMWDWFWTAYRDVVFAQEGELYSYEPFAYRFGLYCPVRYMGNATALIDRAGNDVQYTRIINRHRTLVAPGEAFGGEWWVQDGRQLAHTELSVGQPERRIAINQLVLELGDATPEPPALVRDGA